MSDANLSAPLWFSALTFIGGVLGSQLTELLRTKRERDAHKRERRQVAFEKRNEFQRTNLLALQETAAGQMKSFLFLLNNRSLFDPSDELMTEVSATSTAHQEGLWRIGMLSSRIYDSGVRDAGTVFYRAAQGSDMFLGRIDRQAGVDELFSSFNKLNASIQRYLVKLDSEDTQ